MSKDKYEACCDWLLPSLEVNQDIATLLCVSRRLSTFLLTTRSPTRSLSCSLAHPLTHSTHLQLAHSLTHTAGGHSRNSNQEQDNNDKINSVTKTMIQRSLLYLLVFKMKNSGGLLPCCAVAQSRTISELVAQMLQGVPVNHREKLKARSGLKVTGKLADFYEFYGQSAFCHARSRLTKVPTPC